MKRKMPKTNRPKKPRKVTGSTRRKLERMSHGFSEQSFDEGSKFLTQWELGNLLRLGLDPQRVPTKVNRRKRKSGLAEPAPLPVADAVGGEHPFLTIVEFAKLSQRIDDLSILAKCDSGLLARFAARQAQLEARVALAESALERFVHYETHGFKLVDGSGGGGYSGTISEEVPTDLPAYLPGYYDAVTEQEIANCSPLNQDAGVGLGAIGVPLFEEAGDPSAEEFRRMAWHTIAALKARGLLKHPSRLSRFVRKCVAEVRRFLFPFPRSVAPLDPPESPPEVK